MSKVSLKYLFRCEFADGSTIIQDQEDKSSLDPLRSQFYDVLQKNNTVPISRFELIGDNKSVLLDLQTGTFDINGTSFVVHETLPEEDPERRLIFYRKHTHSFNPLDNSELSHEIDYCLGWQATINGTNYKGTVTIN